MSARDAPDPTATTTLSAARKESFVWSREKLDSYFRAAAFAVLLVLGALAAFRAYFALERAIVTWLQPQWVPLVQAAFSLAMLGIVVWLLRAWVIARAK